MRPFRSGVSRFHTPAGACPNGPVPTVIATGPSAPRLGDRRPLRPVVRAHLRRPAGEAGPRERPRTRLGAALRSLGATRLERLRHDRLVGPEDILLRLAVEQPHELVALDGLAPEQDLGRLLEILAVLLEDRAGELVGFLDDAADLGVDLARGIVGVVRLGGELAAEERLAVVVTEHARTELLGHAEP